MKSSQWSHLSFPAIAKTHLFAISEELAVWLSRHVETCLRSSIALQLCYKNPSQQWQGFLGNDNLADKTSLCENTVPAGV